MSKHRGYHQPNKMPTPHECPDKQDGHSSPQKNPKKRIWLDWELIEKFNFIIALFTIIYSVVTIGLYFIARDSLVVSQRAFVFAKIVNIFNSSHVQTSIVRPPDTPAQIAVFFRNSGQTVSSNETIKIGVLFSKEGIPSGFTFPYTGESQPVLLAPQTETSIFKVIAQTDLAEVESGKKLMFVYGEVNYKDVFGSWHKTKFCFQYFGYSVKPSGEIEEYIFYNGPVHNCADKDCDNNQ